MILKLSIFLAFSSAALACGSLPRSTSNETSPIVGPDTPSDPETVGYFVNHVSLNVNNLTRSIDFYKNVFGMRHLFTYNLSPHVSFTYMSHSQGGRNGTGYQTTEEMIRFKNNNGGHIEFVHLSTPGDDIPGSPQRTSTLNHLGMIVPDLKATQTRLQEHGVTIYKGIEEPMPSTGFLSSKFALGDATNLSDDEFAALQEAMAEFNKQTIFAADPDGNMLEILPLNEPDLFG